MLSAGRYQRGKAEMSIEMYFYSPRPAIGTSFRRPATKYHDMISCLVNVGRRNTMDEETRVGSQMGIRIVAASAGR